MIPETVMRDNLKWSIRLCLTVPPAAPGLMPIGQPGLLRANDKMLMFFHLTRANISALLPPFVEPLSVVVPIVYDIDQNQTTVAQKEINPVISVAQSVLNNLASTGALNMQRCTIMPSVRELLINLTLPNEGPANPGIMHPMGPRGPMGPHMGQMGPGGPQMGGPQMGGPQMGPGGPQMGGPHMGPGGPQMGPGGPQMGPGGPQMGQQMRMMNPQMMQQQRMMGPVQGQAPHGGYMG